MYYHIISFPYITFYNSMVTYLLPSFYIIFRSLILSPLMITRFVLYALPSAASVLLVILMYSAENLSSGAEERLEVCLLYKRRPL